MVGRHWLLWKLGGWVYFLALPGKRRVIRTVSQIGGYSGAGETATATTFK